jgi:hypothetical protein
MKIRIKVPTRLAESLEDKARKAVEEAKEAVANAKKEKQLKQLEELKAKVDDKIAMLKGKKGKKQKVEEGVEEMYGAKDMEEMSDTNMDEAFDPSAVADILGVLAGIGGIAGTGVAIAKWQDKIKAKNPDLYNKLASLGTSFRKAKGIENE